MAEVLEEPERARGAHARLLVVDDDRGCRIDAVHGEHVLDHPHEGLERRRVGVDQAHAPQVEVDRARNVAGGIGSGGRRSSTSGRLASGLAMLSASSRGVTSSPGFAYPFIAAIVLRRGDFTRPLSLAIGARVVPLTRRPCVADPRGPPGFLQVDKVCEHGFGGGGVKRGREIGIEPCDDVTGPRKPGPQCVEHLGFPFFTMAYVAGNHRAGIGDDLAVAGQQPSRRQRPNLPKRLQGTVRGSRRGLRG